MRKGREQKGGRERRREVQEKEEEEEEEECGGTGGGGRRCTCSGVPPTVKLLTAQAASFCVLNSALKSASTIAGTRLVSITI